LPDHWFCAYTRVSTRCFYRSLLPLSFLCSPVYPLFAIFFGILDPLFTSPPLITGSVLAHQSRARCTLFYTAALFALLLSVFIPLLSAFTSLFCDCSHFERVALFFFR
jgi:hypothetical protein